MANKVIQVSFPPKETPLYRAIEKSCPSTLTLAEYARNLLRKALEPTPKPVK